jgi:hypothetical protein
MRPSILYNSEGRQEHEFRGEQSVRAGNNSSRIINPIPVKRMEKLIINVLLGTGFGTYLMALFLNIGTVKGDILFSVGFAFMLVKLIRACIKTWQDYRKEEINIQNMKQNK